MKVEVVAITRPCVEGLTSASEFIAYAARVSNPANEMNKETASKLLDYLKRNNHWSPFEMASATVKIETTRDIARQMLRHRSFSFQEFSQRYAEAEAEPIYREARMQHPTNRQASLPCDNEALNDAWFDLQEEAMHLALENYNWALDKGIAKEVARAVLPEGLTKSTLYMAGSFRSWMHYLEIRTDETTQKEHREVALAIGKALAEQEDIFK